MIATLVIATLLVSIGAANLLLQRYRKVDDNPLIDHIEKILPQTQCAQCGYPGCRPYAEAVAAGKAATNLCAPGGATLMHSLNELVAHTALEELTPPTVTHHDRAFIREAECIGCTLCLPTCPVDAIIGGPGFNHTVVTEHCTGCELCVPACPVDCIEMFSPGVMAPPQVQKFQASEPHDPCIRCGACVPVCPVSLPVQSLFEVVQLEQWQTAQNLSLERCIECGLCDEACPSEIPLEQYFAAGKAVSQQITSASHHRQALKQRYDHHQIRLQKTGEVKQSRRHARLNKPRSWQS